MNESGDETELSTYCVTCGHEFSQKTAMRHMEKCYARVSIWYKQFIIITRNNRILYA